LALVALAGALIYSAVNIVLIEREKERERDALCLEALVVCMEALEVCRCFF
jgi:hypothetical protein